MNLNLYPVLDLSASRRAGNSHVQGEPRFKYYG